MKNLKTNESLNSISGTVEGVIFYNEENGYIVLDMDCGGVLTTAVGNMGDVREGERLTLYGDYINSQKYGRQFKVEIFERAMPENAAAVRKYLGSGVISGIGPAMAKKIVQAFGDDTMDILENHSEQLSSIKGISPERARDIGRDFRNITGLRKAMTFFSKYKIQPVYIAAVWKKFEGFTIQAVTENPYVLCGSGIELPFRDADRVARDLGLPMDSEERISAGIL